MTRKIALRLLVATLLDLREHEKPRDAGNPVKEQAE